MEQMLLMLAIALLVWLAAGIGRDAGSAERELAVGQDGQPPGESFPGEMP